MDIHSWKTVSRVISRNFTWFEATHQIWCGFVKTDWKWKPFKSLLTVTKPRFWRKSNQHCVCYCILIVLHTRYTLPSVIGLCSSNKYW